MTSPSKQTPTMPYLFLQRHHWFQLKTFFLQKPEVSSFFLVFSRQTLFLNGALQSNPPAVPENFYIFFWRKKKRDF
jgi:hypothetical protein